MKLLPVCAALALGEALASFDPELADMWPLPAILAFFTAVFGYGCSLRRWEILFFFLAGYSLFLHSSVAGEEQLRQSPWMRGRVRRERRQMEDCPVRERFSDRMGIGLSHDPATARVNRAILLGERSHLPYRTRRAFVDSGAIHVFAVSGLHVMIVASVLRVTLSLFFVPVRWSAVAAIPLLWGYVLMVGTPPSAVRAALMATFNFLAPAFGRRASSMRGWELAFLAVHTVDPSSIVNVGSLLSFAVMLSLVIAGETFAGETCELKKTAVATLAAWAAGVPIAAQVFGRITPGGLVSNLFLFAAAGYSVGAGAVGALVGFVSEDIAAYFNNFSALFTSAMIGISHAVASLPFSSLPVRRWGWLESAEWYAALALALVLVRSVRRRRNLL